MKCREGSEEPLQQMLWLFAMDLHYETGVVLSSQRVLRKDVEEGVRA